MPTKNLLSAWMFWAGFFLLSCSTPQTSPPALEPASTSNPVSEKREKPEEGPDLQALLSGCTLEHPKSNTILYDCSEMRVSAMMQDSPPDGAILLGYVSSVRAALGAALEEEAFRFTAGGKSYGGMRLSSPDPSSKESRTVEYVVEVPAPPAASYFVRCSTQEANQSGTSRCLAVVEGLAADGLPSGITLKMPGLETAMFLNRPLLVPEGCRVESASEEGAVLGCSGADFAWWRADSPEQGTAVVEDMKKAFSRKLKELGPVKEEAGCRMEGETILCQRLTAKNASEQAVLYIGASALEGRHFVAFCSFAKKEEDFHPICNSLFVTP